MVRFEIRPLAGWNKPKTDFPRRALFKTGWNSTLDLLKREVELLDGAVIATQIDITETDLRRDGMIRANARVGFQGVQVSFDSRHGPLTYATDAFDYWRDNVRAIALGLSALRAVDRYGITRTGEQYRGWQAIAARPMEDTLTPESARLVFADALGIELIASDLTSKEGITRAYRFAAKKYHPDMPGGSESVMRLITKARDVLLGQAR
jgi:hypothetical protein